MQVLVLASSSRYRVELLTRLGIPFTCVAPDVDETAGAGEPPATLAARLASSKALADPVLAHVTANYRFLLGTHHAFAGAVPEFASMEAGRTNSLPAPGWSSGTTSESTSESTAEAAVHKVIIVASDQVASVDGQILGKPGTIAKACGQLRLMSGKPVTFYTSVHLVDADTRREFSAMDTTVAQLRRLSDAEITRYLEADQPLDCAGSFKVESLGISLFEYIDSRDPTALTGLPMITLCEGLRTFGVQLP